MRLILKTLILTIFLAGSLNQTLAQDAQSVFEEGKALFTGEQYALALVKLAPLTSLQENNEMVRFASYYYAVSAYKSGDAPTSKSMFLQIAQRFPDWSELDEVNYWLGTLYFEEDDPRQGINYLDKIQSSAFDEQAQNLRSFHFAQITDMELLTALLSENPKETVLASQLADQILKLDVSEQDIDLLERLSEEYDLSLNLGIEGISGSPKKEVYNVGLFLPFSYLEDSARLERVQKDWTMRFYEGTQVALEKLKEEGLQVNLITFDTRDQSVPLRDMLQTDEARSLDFIIGPVFQSSVIQVSRFAKAQQINMLNPLSSNDEIIRDNPFAFLYYPSNQSLAIAAAEYAKVHFRENKNVAVFYSGLGDRPRASLYKEILEKDSFNVPIFEMIRPQESSKIQVMLVEEEEVDKDSLVVADMLAEMDSLREAGEEDWEIYDERDFLKKEPLILPDSIGHIFVASDAQSLSASTISAIDAREDTIMYIGSSRFLSSEQGLSFEQLERINAIFTGSNWIQYDQEEVRDFRERYEFAYNAYPHKDERLGDAYLGYDIIITYGRLLHQYGKYFQVGLKRKAGIKGALTEEFDYRFSNDNRFIPIFRITNSQVVPVEDTANAQNRP
ncbi:MAG: ABC transporter substrate-binding protein [Roseivirga sp.]|nr:ABC transporter substrate-binding protein [Roseivirga sp.]